VARLILRRPVSTGLLGLLTKVGSLEKQEQAAALPRRKRLVFVLSVKPPCGWTAQTPQG